MNNIEKKKQKIVITDKREVAITSVESILFFDENQIVVDGEFGKLFVEGQSLKVEELNKEQKTLSLTGDVNAVYYSEKKQKKGLFS